MANKPKLLVSIWTMDEVAEALSSDIDIVDIKDPSSGSLGLPKLDMVLSTLNMVKGLKETSVAVGDIRRYSNSLDYITYTLCHLGVNYIKIGLEVDEYNQATLIASSIIGTVKTCSNRVNTVFVGYADWQTINSLEPMKIVQLARDVDADGVMIDTRIKDGRTTFDHLPLHYLRKFVEKAHENSLFAAIAGGLKIDCIPLAVRLGFDVIGVRTAACSGNRLGKISKDAIKSLKEEIERALKSL